VKWSFVSAVNNEQVLRSCLLNSPDIGTVQDVILQRGYASAARAYNAGIDKANGDLVVFAHQDVYFPEGWLASARSAVEALSSEDPDWGVVGVWGVKRTGDRAGHVYCAGLMKTLGGPFEGGREVRSLDEVVLIVRKSSGLRFDERLRGFHMYGADICLEAERRGMKCYAISALCIHNTNGYNMLPLQFWKRSMFLRRKWKRELPISTPCIDVTFWCWPMIRWNIVQAANIMLGRHHAGKRVQDPSLLSRELASRTATND
jgi:hypothetical protein